MTSTFDQDAINALEKVLAKFESNYERERIAVEKLLAECGRDKVQPAKDYWHKLDALRRKVNLLREMLGTPQ